MVLLKCPKCGKEYQRKAYYDKHIGACTGKKLRTTRAKSKDSFVSEERFNNVLEKIEKIETRINNLEKEFKKLNIIRDRNKSKKSIALSSKNDAELISIIRDIINQTSNPYSIKGVISLDDLKRYFEKNYNLSQKSFEEMILKLYRKAFIDLQAGGTPKNYQLKSPTGKEFFYLMIKEE